MSGDVLHGLSGVVRCHQLRVNRNLSIADRIEQVGEAGDECRLTQSDAVVGFCCGYWFQWLAPCNEFPESGQLDEFGAASEDIKKGRRSLWTAGQNEAVPHRSVRTSVQSLLCNIAHKLV